MAWKEKINKQAQERIIMIFDSHAHYDDESFDNDRDELLNGLKENGVGYVVNISASLDNCLNTLELIKRYDFIYGTIGVHPSETGELKDADEALLREYADNEKIVAIGEIGLDYYYPEPDRDCQKHWFRKQIDIAKSMKLPLVIHSRDAAADTLSIIKEERAMECGGVIHCFSYEKEMAREYLNMGFNLGIGGVVTFKNARKLKEAVQYAPIEQIVLETDCPYLAPEPFRGKRNDSSLIKYVAAQVAELKDMYVNDVIRITEENAKKMYNIK